MNDIASESVGPMLNPPHLGELIRESMDDVGWNVTETAARLGCFAKMLRATRWLPATSPQFQRKSKRRGVSVPANLTSTHYAVHNP